MDLSNLIIGAESNGNPNATNPRSSATGAGQFIERTWLDMLAKNRPDIKGTEAELLALRKDPILSKEMTDAYSAENQKKLSDAGVPVTPGSTYLAHFAGPQGAVSILKADPSAPVSSVLSPGAMRANPFLRTMTVGDLRGWADGKVGGGQGQPASPASPPRPIPQMAQQAPIFAQQQAEMPQMRRPMPQPEMPQFTPQFMPQAPQQQPMPASPLMPGAPPPIFGPPRKPIDIRQLQAALARPSGGFFFS